MMNQMLRATLGGSVIGIVVLFAVGMCSFTLWEAVRHSPRRFVWVLCGIAGLPAVSLGVIYFSIIGIVIILVAFALGAATSFTRHLQHLPAALYALVLGAAVLWAHPRHLSLGDVLATLGYLGDVFLALLATSKLGRIAAGGLSEPSRPSSSDAPA